MVVKVFRLHYKDGTAIPDSTLNSHIRHQPAVVSPKSGVIDITECVKSAVESVKLFAKNIRWVDFQLQYDLNTKVFLKGDSVEFIAALSNILRNSVEALDKEKGQIFVKLDFTQEFFELSVSDNGCGIKSENLHRIFDNKVSIGKINGTGIGLFQVKTAIEKRRAL